MPDATPTPQPPNRMRPQPFATWNPTRGIWETSQLDLYGQSEPYSAIWPTSGWMHGGSAYQLPLSVLLTPASASSSSPTVPLFRTPLASDSSRGGEMNRPGESGDSVSWEGWSHVRKKYVAEVSGRVA